MSRIKWTADKISNIKFLQRMKILDLRLLKIIQCNKRKYLQQWIEKETVFARVVQGEIVEKPTKGRRRKNKSIFNILRCLKI